MPSSHRSHPLLRALLVAAFPAIVGAQASIAPGMTKAQVIEKLGAPTASRTTGSSTYLFYKNGQEKKMGMNDVVVLEGDKVVDAIFRSSTRRFEGKSSSPAPVSAEAARHAKPTPADPTMSAARSQSTGTVALPSPAARPAQKALLPAEQAQLKDVAKPMPPATKAPEKQADPKAAPDPKALPDPKAPPTKRP
jgi:hypothetical protein